MLKYPDLTPQVVGDAESWTRTICVPWAGPGSLRELLENFDLGERYSGPGRPFAHAGWLTRVRIAGEHFIILRQSGGLDI